MPLIADTGAVGWGGKPPIRDDPAEFIQGWPGTSAILQSRKVNFTLTNLGTTTKVYTSGIKSDIVSLAKFYANLGATIDIEEGPVYRLTVTLPYDEFSNLDTDPTKYTLWEVTPNAAERDIYQVGIFSPERRGGQISSTRQKVSLQTKGAIDLAYRNPQMTVNIIKGPNNNDNQYVAETFLALKRLRADGVASFTQTVRRTLMVNTLNSGNYIDPVSEGNPSNVNVLLSVTDLISLYNIPANIRVHLMPSYARFVSVPQDAVDMVVLAGYLVKKPTLQQVTPNKIQFTQEFVWDEWLDALYRPRNGNYNQFPPI